ncbi:MAG TPA: beta-ketoacyl-[acyl-carrier-protein] synthase family protein [Methylomusa anaerophila]|uniref:Actinorhodin polyketide putative beta-ketoacyl synthase 1 n=1 Tax=Methylomusa anaerophila TaxID=1930071 RepID=A0A348AIP9_9FIRM|nr:beta-ketoacyl-[acyl-carrier-protein] synthase family protein [Methylomusa anaerophila]BBB90947.1 actinorhodin polyketide putative beta-ketoacyl synthase 1 [Methylomusa anaerophila]HML90426.1 beta-ketoacyl-[acyl-carrier-protein] synthase family protein [Methylomusa anaerophila]
MKSKASEKRRVVVTGLGVISPIGIGKDKFWENCIKGKSGIKKIDRFPVDQFQSQICAAVDDFDPKEFDLKENQILRLDRYAQFAVAAAKMAIKESKLNMDEINPRRAGVSIANAISGTPFMEEEFLRQTEKGTEPFNTAWTSKALYPAFTYSTASLEVAAEFNFRGPCSTLPTGCAAGLDAIGFSFDMIRGGYSDVMITGASEAPICSVTLAAFDVLGAVSSKRNATPEKASRPFDKERDGFVLGEGCGILVLEEREHALRRGAVILAEIYGHGSTCNAYHMTELLPDGEDLKRALEIALQDAGVSPDQIDYISSHGSSTQQNDVNGTAAYKAVLGKRAYEVPVSSLKSMNGHALAAASAMEVVACVQSLVNKEIHPTINYEYPDSRCDLNYVPNKSIKKDNLNLILKDASGFSGIHSALVMGTESALGG